MLTVKQIQNARPGRHLDQRGLYLSVSPTGRKTWILRYSRDKKVTEASLGSAEFIGLADARSKAFEFRKALASGASPASKRVSFMMIAHDVLQAKVARFKRGASTAAGMQRALTYLTPLSDRDCQSISVADVTALLKPIWVGKPAMAEKVRSVLESILDAAKVRGLRTGDNVAAWKSHLSHVLPKRVALSRGHNAAMPYSQVPAFLRELETQGGVICRALRLNILLGLRKNETLGLRWGDVQDDVLTIPADRTKQKREHRVPLSGPALAIITEQRALGEPGEFIFPSPIQRGRKITTNCFNGLMLRKGLRFTPHGFRSAFSDWAHDQTDHSVETIEGCLGHLVGNAVSRSYRRGDNLERRRDLMQSWANYLTSATNSVTL